MKRRIERAQRLMTELGLDMAVISDPKSVYYFTGFLTSRPIRTDSYLLLSKNRSSILFTGSTEVPFAEKTFGGEIATYVNYDLNKRMVPYPDFVTSELKKFLHSNKYSAGTLGIESWSIPQILMQAITSETSPGSVADLSQRILGLRMIKDPDELEHIRRSCELGDFAYSIASSQSVPGKSEVEVYSFIHQELAKKVGTFQFFAGDFVSGERSLQVGGPPSPRILRKGETFITDLWITTKSYFTDTSRTFVVGHEPSAEQEHAMEVLKQVITSGEDKLRPGVKASDVYKAVLHAVTDAGYKKYFPHHAGHCIGLEPQEPPFFIPGCQDELAEKMVCTLEPGLYIPEIGGMRIENNYLITSHGFEQLSKFPVAL